MKKMRLTIIMFFAIIVFANCQDDTFNKVMHFRDSAYFEAPIIVYKIIFPDSSELSSANIVNGIVEWDGVLYKPDFATVATTGSYNDLKDKPGTKLITDYLEELGFYFGKTTAELDAIVPVNGFGIALNKTTGYYMVYSEGKWETVITDR